MAKYVIEHLEPRMWKWCLIEYKHIANIIGRKDLLFTNVRGGSKELDKCCYTTKKSVKVMNLKNACLLDPAAEKTLTPKEAKKFDYFIFGGILGDYPAKKRTKKLLTPFVKAETRNIGKKQMSTDNAVAVVRMIEKGTPLEKIRFRQGIEISIKEGESVTLPYKYAVINNAPLISDELVTYLKRKRGF